MKLGVIGCGSRICGFINNCLREIEPNLKLAGIVDPDPEGVKKRLGGKESLCQGAAGWAVGS